MSSSSVDFLCINKSIYIKNFTLKIHGINKNNFGCLDQISKLLHSSNFEIKLKIKDDKYLIKEPIIFVQNEKIIFNEKYKEKLIDGKLEFIWTNRFGDKIIVLMDLEIVKSIDFVSSFEEVNNYLLKCINTYQKYEGFCKDEIFVNRLINNNIYAITDDLERIKKPIQINFTKDKDNSIRFVQNSAKIIYEEIISNSDFSDDLYLEVKFKERKIKLFPTDKFNIWKLDLTESLELPKNGLFEIYLTSPNIFQYKKSNTEIELEAMKNELYEIRKDTTSIVHRRLSNLINPNINNKLISSDNDFQKVFNETKYNSLLNNLDQDQKNALLSLDNKEIILVTGFAGCGKTESGIFAALLCNELNQRVLMTSETNRAIDNFLERILNLKNNFPNLFRDRNIVRLRSRYSRDYNTYLAKYNLDNVILNIKKLIYQKCKVEQLNTVEQKLQYDFRRIFTKNYILYEIIPLSFDIVLSTYGKIATHRSFFTDLQNFLLNITDASSSIYLSQYILGANKCNKWIVLGEKLQLSPRTIGDYFITNHLFYPDEKQLNQAIKYDSKNLSHRRKISQKSRKDYRSSILEFLQRMKTEDINSNLVSFQLNSQYRIHPVIHSRLISAFDLDDSKINYPKKTDFLDYSHLASFSNMNDRIEYTENRTDEKVIVENLLARLKIMIDEINFDSPSSNISIGIGLDNIDSVRLFISLLQNKFDNIKTNAYQKQILFQNKNIDVTISSVKNHQEKEYDIFLFGITKSNLKFSDEQIYTALSRAASYLFIFGPQIDEIRPVAIRKKIVKLVVN